MLFQRKDLPELYYLKHRNDDSNNHVEYESKILNSSLSPYIYKNDLMNSWLQKMQPLVSLIFDQMNVMKNFKNYIVDKYEYRHTK
jgi:hypothetical protein